MKLNKFDLYLKNNKDDGEEAIDSVEYIHTVGVEVDYEVCCELKKMINKGSNTKDKSSCS